MIDRINKGLMKTIVLLFLFSLQIQSYSQSISIIEAKKAAQCFFGTDDDEIPKLSYISKSETDTFYYVFNYHNYFVIFSANKNCPPLLAYSYESNFYPDNIIPPLKMWLDHYQKQISTIISENIKHPEMNQSWDKFLNSDQKAFSEIESFDPFLSSKWGQGDNFNFYCPRDLAGSNGRAATGCVATAMAQIMYYYRFPRIGAGSYSYVHDEYGTISANFGTTLYDYNAMHDIPFHINSAASLLISHCGVAVDMDYGPDGSGMYNHKAAYAMRTHFRYSPETQYVFRDSTTLDWDSLIVSHLHKSIPLYYAGWNNPNIDGHAFVCDGYQKDSNSNYYYHFNFGWDGYADGYFYTSALSPSGYNFNLAQEIIINGYPDTAANIYPLFLQTGSDTLRNESGSFEDGSGPIEGYANNMNYYWIIKPDLDSIEYIKLTLKYSLNQNDTIFISSNDPLMQPIILYGDTSSISINVFCSEIIVNMKSDSQGNADGFEGNYTSYFPLFCSSTIIKSSVSGTAEDGSGDSDYNNCSRCQIAFRIFNVNYITLNFNNFETEADKDILYIYDYATSAHPLLATLSGTLLNNHYTFNTNKLNLIFETSAENAYSGWDLTYTSGTVGIEQMDNSQFCIIYPNPTNGIITLQINTNQDLNDNFSVEIIDLYGQLIKKQQITEMLNRIDLSNLASGVYIFKVYNKKHNLMIQRIVKY